MACCTGCAKRKSTRACGRLSPERPTDEEYELLWAHNLQIKNMYFPPHGGCHRVAASG